MHDPTDTTAKKSARRIEVPGVLHVRVDGALVIIPDKGRCLDERALRIELAKLGAGEQVRFVIELIGSPVAADERSSDTEILNHALKLALGLAVTEGIDDDEWDAVWAFCYRVGAAADAGDLGPIRRELAEPTPLVAAEAPRREEPKSERDGAP